MDSRMRRPKTEICEAPISRLVGLQDASAENGNLRGADKPPCGHLSCAFCAKGHVQVDVVEDCTDEEEQHRRKQQVQGALVAVGDISADGVSVYVSKEQLVQPIHSYTLQKGGAIDVVQVFANGHRFLFQGVSVGAGGKFDKGIYTAELVVRVGETLDGAINGKDDIGILEKRRLPILHDGRNGKGAVSHFPNVSHF